MGAITDEQALLPVGLGIICEPIAFKFGKKSVQIDDNPIADNIQTVAGRNSGWKQMEI